MHLGRDKKINDADTYEFIRNTYTFYGLQILLQN